MPFFLRCRGAPKVEYPLLLGGIATVVIAALALTGTRVSDLFSDTALDEVATTSPTPGSPPPNPPPSPPTGTPFLVVSGPDTLSYGAGGDGGRNLYGIYRLTNTGDGPLAGPVSAVSDSATILYGLNPGDDIASLWLDVSQCAAGLAPGQSCFLVVSSNVGAGNFVGFSNETVSFSLAQANAPSFSISVNLSGAGEAQASWTGDNFGNFGDSFITSLPDRTSIYTLTLSYNHPAQVPLTVGTLVLDNLESTFTVLSDGCSGQTLTPPSPSTSIDCTITYVLNDTVAPGTPIFGSFRLPSSGASDVLVNTIAP